MSVPEVQQVYPYHTETVAQTLERFQTDELLGLKDEEVELRRAKYGKNRLQQQRVNAGLILLKQVANGLTVILLIATVLSFVTQQWTEAIVVLIVIISNTLIGFVQEYKSHKTMNALQKLAAPKAKVVRDGVVVEISTTMIVPGDIIVLKDGSIIPADLRLIETKDLYIDEAILTGENEPVHKVTDPVKDVDCPLGDRVNMAYMSTVVTKGRGKGVVVATGMKTEVGKIAKELKKTKTFNKTPLLKRLDIMAYVLFGFSLILAVIVYGANRWQFDTEVTLYAISLSVAIIPEGMVAVVSLTLSVGVKRMAKRKALVKRIEALEALGQATNICSDKTGTLTQAKMFAQQLWLAPNKKDVYTVTGTGILPKGDILDRHNKALGTENFSFQMKQFMYCIAMCNTANIIWSEDAPYSLDTDGRGVKAIGEPTEIALAVLSIKAGVRKQELQAAGYRLWKECEFTHDLKKMSVYVRPGKKAETVVGYLKGAPERVLDCCTHIMTDPSGETQPLTDKLRKNVMAINDKFAAEGLRVLGIAYRPDMKTTKKELAKIDRSELEKEFVFLGLVGILDPPRAQSRPAVITCYNAGIVVHMATGDQPLTAVAIAKKVAILQPDDLGIEKGGHAVTAATFDKMTDEEIDALDEVPRVVARCSPQSKVKLIEALHRRKKFVVMTGDGVNDAPALKKADIGVAMGQTGSDVTREVADIILTDDNFATIVRAIAEGRRIFANISKFIIHLLAGNVAEVIALVIGLCIQDSSGRSVYILSPLQILWLNMITSSPPALGLGMERANVDLMKKPPRPKSRGLFTIEVVMDIIFYGIIAGGCTLGSFVFTLYVWGNGELGTNCNLITEFTANCDWVYRARATAFLTMNFLILLMAIVCKHTKRSLIHTPLGDNMTLFWILVVGALVTIPPVYIPKVNLNIFKQTAIDQEWILIGASIVIFLGSVEIYKLCKRRCMTKPEKYVIPYDEHDHLDITM